MASGDEWYEEYQLLQEAFANLQSDFISAKRDADRYCWLKEQATLQDTYDLGYSPRSNWQWMIELPTGKQFGTHPPADTPDFETTLDLHMQGKLSNG